MPRCLWCTKLKLGAARQLVAELVHQLVRAWAAGMVVVAAAMLAAAPIFAATLFVVLGFTVPAGAGRCHD